MPDKGLRMVDTLYARARKIGDLKAQCIALYLRVEYYYYQKNDAQLVAEFKRISPFILRTPYLQYYFGSWYFLIARKMNLNLYSEALLEINKLYEEALQLNSAYGKMQAFVMQGDVYFRQNLFRFALPQFIKAYDFAQNNKIDSQYILYRIGVCCFHQQRWDEAEEAFSKGVASLFAQPQDVMPYYLYLLNVYCCKDTMNIPKIKETYDIVDRLYHKYPTLNTGMYNQSMYYYNEYYTKNLTQALFFYNVEKNAFIPDSVVYFWKRAMAFDKAGNEEEAAKSYREYVSLTTQMRVSDGQALFSLFVPQLEYQKVLHERESLSQKATMMKLKRLRDSEQLMSLNEEHDRLVLFDRDKEHSILQNRLLMQRMFLTKQEKKIANQRLLVQQQAKTEQLKQAQQWWKIVFSYSFIIIAFLLLVLYILYNYRARKKLYSEKVKAEKAKQMKSLFFQNMNHEIRNPLNAIIGFNDVLNGNMAEELSSEQRTEFVKMISTNCQLLKTLVNDVLDLSNFESGTYHIALANVDIYHLCRTALESMRGRENYGVELIYKPYTESVFLLQTDAQRLQQVLTNYLSNACKYTDKGSITLSYEVFDDIVRFAVTDTGIGVKPEDAKKVFERFQMLEKSKRGTGLGLHICKLIAKLLRGRVYLDTHYAKGARFVFDHPLKSLLLLIISSFFSVMPLRAQHNSLHMQDHLYRYFQKIELKLNEPIALKMIDTLISRSIQSKDLIAQGNALQDRIRHYRYVDNDKMLLRSFEEAKLFYIKHKQYDGLFSSWIYIVNYYLRHKQFDEALKQLIDFQNEANRVKDASGISSYFYAAGLFYVEKEQYGTASSYFLQSLNSSDEDIYSCYVMLGECNFELKNYTQSIDYMRKAIAESYAENHKCIPYLYILKSYSMLGDVKHAKEAYQQVLNLKKKNPKWIDRPNFEQTMYLYYSRIKKDKALASEWQLQIGNRGSSIYLANYYMDKRDYAQAKHFYKEVALQRREWLRTDPGSLLEVYTSNFNYGVAIRDRDRLSRNNLQMQLVDVANDKELLKLKRDRTKLLLRKSDIEMRQKRDELALQQMLLGIQRDNLEKSKVWKASIHKQEGLHGERIHWQWRLAMLFIVAFVVLGILVVRFIRQREQWLRKEMLKAQHEERIKDRFFQNVNNKIRGPLDTIVELNQKLNVNDASHLSQIEKKQMMEELNKSGSYLTTLVNEVLDVSKMESGTYKVNMEKVDIYSLCRLALKNASAEVHDGVSLHFECKVANGGDATLFYLNTDVQRLSSVLDAYLLNACQYTQSGSITLDYEVFPMKVVFRVTDTGQGIPPEDQSTIFMRDQLDAKQEDTGLSLHIVKLIADLLHGEALLDTTYKEGARFMFVHPIVPTDEQD